jgi:hypothetical protein
MEQWGAMGVSAADRVRALRTYNTEAPAFLEAGNTIEAHGNPNDQG